MRSGSLIKKVTKMWHMISARAGKITKIRPEMTFISKIKTFLTKNIYFENNQREVFRHPVLIGLDNLK